MVLSRQLNELLINYANIPGINIRERVFSVDSFQGQQADMVIISLVRNGLSIYPKKIFGFLIQKERLNVMLSRSRRILVLIGNHDSV